MTPRSTIWCSNQLSYASKVSTAICTLRLRRIDELLKFVSSIFQHSLFGFSTISNVSTREIKIRNNRSICNIFVDSSPEVLKCENRRVLFNTNPKPLLMWDSISLLVSWSVPSTVSVSWSEQSPQLVVGRNTRHSQDSNRQTLLRRLPRSVPH